LGLKQRLWDLLSSGAPVSVLNGAGIDATGIESFDLVTNVRTRMRIMVRRADLDAARALVEAS